MSRAWPVPNLDPDASLAHNARRVLAVRVAELFSYAPAVTNEAAIEPLHALRIAAKRLRYTLELFRTVFGDDGEQLIERIKALQELLGTIHDHDVRIALIEQELITLAAEQSAALGAALAETPPAEHQAITAALLQPGPDDPRLGLLSLLGRQRAERRRHYRAFVRRWRRDLDRGLRRQLAALSAAPIEPAGAMTDSSETA